MNRPPIQFHTGKPRICCPACFGTDLKTLGDIPYVSTLVKWGLDPAIIRSRLYWDPEEYSFQIEQCWNCGTRFTSTWFPELTEVMETSHEFFRHHDEDYFKQAQPIVDIDFVRTILESPAGYLNPYQQRFLRIYEEIRKILSSGKPNTTIKLLDMGAAYGSVARFLQLSISGLDVWASELNPISRLRISERYPDLAILGARMASFSSSAKFDVLYCADVVEHVPDLSAFLRDVRSVVKPGGVALIVTPDGACPNAVQHGLDWWGFIVPHHCQILTRKGLSCALEIAGFRCQDAGVSDAEEMWMLAR